MQDLRDKLNTIKENLRFKYSGGGYFRDKTIAKGQNADIVHGAEILDVFIEEIVKEIDNLH